MMLTTVVFVFIQFLVSSSTFLELDVNVDNPQSNSDIVSKRSTDVFNLHLSSNMGSYLLWNAKYHPISLIPKLRNMILDADSKTRNRRKLRGISKVERRNSMRRVDKLDAVSTLLRRDENTSLFINWHWDIGNENGQLNIPRDERDSSDPYKLIVDVGLEYGSNLVCDVHKDPSLVYIGIEANLVNFGVSHHNMLHKLQKDDITRKRILLLPLGLSNETKNVQFNENHAPACGSILKSKAGGWWCTHTTNSYEIPVTRLDYLLSKVPEHYQFHYLKIDVEGADHLVIFGAGKLISKFHMVSMECRPPKHQAGDLSREGTCQQAEMIVYMASYGFSVFECDFEDCHFAKPEYTLHDVKQLFKKCHGAFDRYCKQ